MNRRTADALFEANLRELQSLTDAETIAPVAKALGFYIVQRAGVNVLVFLSQGCHPATHQEVALWNALFAERNKTEGLQSSVTRFFDNALLSKSETDESSVCVDCNAITGGPHTPVCEIQSLRFALRKSLQEKL